MADNTTNDELSKTDIDDRLDSLKNLPQGITINQLIIGNQINHYYGYDEQDDKNEQLVKDDEPQNADNNDQINQNNAPPDKTQIARAWIAANNPTDHEYVTNHKRYLVAHPDGLTRPKLSKLVVEFDFIKKRTNAGICWVLN